jgi:hypothetical protein
MNRLNLIQIVRNQDVFGKKKELEKHWGRDELEL